MAFFDDQTDQPQDTVEPVIEKVKVGEKEYTQDELKELVGLGELGREMEEKYNTKFDKVYPAYTRTTQELKELKEYKEQQEKQAQNVPLDVDEEVAIRQAREAAKRVGLVTSDDIDEIVKKRMPDYYKEQRATEKILDEVNGLASKLTGNDGRPAFKAEEMLEFMRDSGISNAETAYKVRYEKELDEWKEKQLSSAKKTSIYTNDRAATPQQPSQVKITRDNLNDAIREELYGTSE